MREFRDYSATGALAPDSFYFYYTNQIPRIVRGEPHEVTTRCCYRTGPR